MMRMDITVADVRTRWSTGLLTAVFAVMTTALLASFGARAASLGAGLSHSCALADAGRVKCWGANNFRQLGDGTTTDRLTPADVTALSEPLTTIAVGGNHACGLTAAGSVKCWGLNQYGQLGDGTATETAAAVSVVGLQSGIVAVAAGRRHSCALTSAGAVKCWGSNEKGQLGDGGTTDSSLPVDVIGLQSGVAAVLAGGYGTCAVTSAGAAKCWGDNTYGQLGDGTTNEAQAPVDAVGLGAGVADISISGSRTCARLNSGGAKCWGLGPLGNGADNDSSVPVDVQTLGADAIAVAVGFWQTCALTSAGSVKCWGYNDSGNLGDGSYSTQLAPTLVQGLESGATEIATNDDHTCARLQSGELRCWGFGANGQLGDGIPSRRLVATDVVGLGQSALSIAPGALHACALTTSGAVQCWGNNLTGALGDGTWIPHLTPADVQGLDGGIASISSGLHQTCALTAAGGVLCWGETSHGRIPVPVGVMGLNSGIQALSLGSRHGCVVTETGGAKCWGQNGAGQLGDGTNVSRLDPVDVTGLTSGVASIAAGYYHTCAITTVGSVKCWGSNGGGVLGDGTTTPSSVPVDVVGLNAAAVAVATDGDRTCALTDAGRVKCWGLGVTVPTEVAGLGSDIVKISVGSIHACAVNRDGGLKCWGRNNDGQLGDGTTTESEIPVDVVGLTSGVAAVSAGDTATCAVTQAGAAKCWGNNWSGQLGNGEAGFAGTPHTVVGSPFSDRIFGNGFD